MTDAAALAERLNQECECLGTDAPALQRRLGLETYPHLFSDVPVFLAAEHVRQMQRAISAVETVTHLPAYQEEVLGRAPAIARAIPRARGVFFGFDFHIAADGPKLIEINTNAGGALLNVEMQRAQQFCCPPVADAFAQPPTAEAREQLFVDMFMEEWRLSRGSQPLRTVAIVDDAPAQQYLFPEFLLFKNLFESRGIRSVIVDATELEIVAGSLVHDNKRIDLVYNRCTDFSFVEPSHSALADAYVRGLAVITPHPHAHALYSNKENLVLLCDGPSLRAMHAADADVETLTRVIPQTRRVEQPEQPWWNQRKQWFFKPSRGFGSRGAYRGDKMTRRVFGDVMRGGYIAQRLVPPSERRRGMWRDCFKLDVRSYVYKGAQQLLAARLYQGQTTNFRSAGGGFAPVYPLHGDQSAVSCSVERP